MSDFSKFLRPIGASASDSPAESVSSSPEPTKADPTVKILSEQQEQLTEPDVSKASKPRSKKPKIQPAANTGTKSDDEFIAAMAARAAAAYRRLGRTTTIKGRNVSTGLGPSSDEVSRARQQLRERYSDRSTWRADCAHIGLFAQVKTPLGNARALPHLIDVRITEDYSEIVFQVTFPGVTEEIMNPFGASADRSTIQRPDPRDGAGESWNLRVPAAVVIKSWHLDVSEPPMPWIEKELPKLASALHDRDTPEQNRWIQLAHSASITRIATRQEGIRGKAVTKERILAPRVVGLGVGPRGPYVDVKPVVSQGQTVADIGRATDKLRAVFEAPHLTVDQAGDGLVARLNMNTQVLTFPSFVSVDPEDFTRPTCDDPEASIIKCYPDLTFPLGVTIDGRMLNMNLQKAVHILIAGTTGSGKSRTIQSAMCVLCCQGAQVVIAAAKKGDWEPLMQPGVSPGVLHVSSSTAGILRLVSWVVGECERREAAVEQLRRDGINDFPFPPLVFLFEEMAKFIRMLADDRATLKFVKNALDTIARIGRSVRVHLVSVSQDVYADSFSGNLLGLVSTRLALGKYQKMTAEKLFSKDLDTATALMHEIGANIRGRGVIIDEETGVIEMIQVPFVWSPAAPPKEWSDTNRANWTKWQKALAATPRIQSRFGWQFPLGAEAMEKHWSTWDFEELRENLFPINLDIQTEFGEWEPRRDRTIYDPSSNDYAGGTSKVSGAHSPVE